MAVDLKERLKNTDLYRKYDDWHWRERKISFGNDFSDKTFYVIRRHANRAGLFSFVMTNLGAVCEASEKGFIPVIDMQNSPNPMLTEEEVGRVNAWDLYFGQPGGYTLEEIAHAKNVVLGSIHPPVDYPGYEMLQDNRKLLYWRQQFHTWFHVRKEIADDAESYYFQQMRGKEVLGVLCRGTDYTGQKAKGHPVQPDPQTTVKDCRRIMEQDGFDTIYLATEDKIIWELFERSFPGKIISFQQHHYSLADGQLINDAVNAAVGTREANREYLTSIVLLSRCSGLLAGAAGGTYGALLMSEEYRVQHVYQLGLY